MSYLESMHKTGYSSDCMDPDYIDLKIEIGPSVFMVYGTFLRGLWFLKESLFSWDQFYTETADVNNTNNYNTLYNKTRKCNEERNSTAATGDRNTSASGVSRPYLDIPVQLALCNQRDPRYFRPLSVDVSLAIHKLNGHLVVDSPSVGEHTPPCPIAFTNRLALELVKNYQETKLQLFIDPVNLFVEDMCERAFDANLTQGHLCLSSIQFRGHAMFSDEGRLRTDGLEYAWLIEILMGELTGSITPMHTEQLVHGLETLVTLLLESDYQLNAVFADRIDPALPFKYEVTRFSLDLIDIYLVESGTALNFNVNR